MPGAAGTWCFSQGRISVVSQISLGKITTHQLASWNRKIAMHATQMQKNAMWF